MKKTYLSIIPLVAIGLVFAFNYDFSDNTEIHEKTYQYKPLTDMKNAKDANGAIAYKNLIYRDAVSGKINRQKLADAKADVRQKMLLKSSNFSFVEEGPDNVGGRTRGIAIHPDSNNVMFAGSVSGGLFVTRNYGTNWSRVQEFDDAMLNSAIGTGSLGISSIAITNDGVLYVATGGEQYEGSLTSEYSGNITGDGIWYSQSTYDFSFSQLTGTNNRDVLKVVAHPSENNSIFYVGESTGLIKVVDYSPQALTNVPNSTVIDFKISSDGQVMILGLTAGTRIETMLSNDAGSTWTNLHDNGSLNGFGNARAEYSISGNSLTNGSYVLYAVFANNSGQLAGVYRTIDNGITWYQIAPGATGNFRPLSNDVSGGQGKYDLVILSSDDGEFCTLGGINLWEWQHTPNGAADNGQWYVSSASWSPTLPNYIHADNHRLVYNSDGFLVVGNDGGIQIRNPQGFGTVMNKGYNVTQFYGMGYGGNGSVIAGAQDNGTQYKDNSIPWSKEFSQVMGGDGFDCEISYLDNNAFISTLYYGVVMRSNDKGTTSQYVGPPTPNIPGTNSGAFYNAIAMMENANDLNTRDSISFSPDVSKSAGDTITYYSLTHSIPIKHVLSQNLNVYQTMSVVGSDTFYTRDSTDTIVLPDYVQSYFVAQGEYGIRITRDIMRFTVIPEWWDLFYVNGSQNNDIHSFEFSTDMNYLWSGSYNGQLTRTSGLANTYDINEAHNMFKPQISDSLVLNSTGDTITGSAIASINFETDYSLYSYINGSPVTYKLNNKTFSLGNTISDISVDPTNPDKVCVVIGGTSSTHVYYSTNATSDNATFSAIDGDLPDMPVFGCVIERDPTTDVIVIGTEYGIFSTDNIAGNNTVWTANNDEIGPVPVFDVCQQWRDWEEGLGNGIRRVENPGAIYACTHGRGIWRADNLLSIQEPIEFNELKEDLSSISVYPNPSNDFANVAFAVNKSNDVTIELYDLNGKLVKSVINNNTLNSGQHNIRFDVTDFPLGTYIILVKTDNDQKVVKFIKY